MGLLDALKKKETKPAAPGPPPPPVAATAPVQLVVSLTQQGKSDAEIVQELTRQGYNQTQIYDAIVQSRSMGGPEPFSPPKQPEATQTHTDKEQIQEETEKIVDQRLTTLNKRFDEIHAWTEKASTRMEQLETKVADLKADLENLHKAIVGKVGEYDRNLMDVGVELKAMEQVFKKVLPELTNNVQELSRISSRVKGSTDEKKKKR